MRRSAKGWKRYFEASRLWEQELQVANRKRPEWAAVDRRLQDAMDCALRDDDILLRATCLEAQGNRWEMEGSR